MRTYQGGCHCGAVRFEFETDLDAVTVCTCSICTKKGLLHHRVPPERFRLLSGEDELTLYQFGTKTARHRFCRICGVQPFANPRSHPDQITVNVRCLDDFDPDEAGLPVHRFDGRNWEAAMAERRAAGKG